MTVSAKPLISPMLWLALLFTLGLVYWQWSAAPQAELDLVAARPAKKTVANDAVTISADRSDNRLETPPSSTDAISRQTANPHAETAVMTAADAFKRQLPTGKPRHVLFAAHEWLPPPPKPGPAPTPQVPPLPYTYVGSMQEVAEVDLVILLQQQKVLLAKIGSQLSPQWRLDREDKQAVYFTYLPLNKPAMLSKTKPFSQRQNSANAENNYPEEILNQ